MLYAKSISKKIPMFHFLVDGSYLKFLLLGSTFIYITEISTFLCLNIRLLRKNCGKVKIEITIA